MGIGDFIREKQAQGMSNEDILPLVKERFPHANTTINSIRWYRTNPVGGKRSSPQQTANFLPRVQKPNTRYGSYPIGNAQNGVIRNILSNLGEESFSELNWLAAKAHFANKCVYCGEQKKLVVDHAVPINRANLGEHRIGNMLPSCDDCNARKGGNKDFKEFLERKDDKIEMILAYMQMNNYTPLGDNKQVKVILELAHKEVAAVAERYIAILNNLLHDKPAAQSS